MATECRRQGSLSPELYPGQILHQAAIYNNGALLLDLLEGEEREHVNAVDAVGRTVLHTAVSNHSLSCCQVLLDNGADVNVRCTKLNGMTPLHQAVVDDQTDIVRLLMARGADVTMPMADGLLAVDIAKGSGFTECQICLEEATLETDSLIKEFEMSIEKELDETVGDSIDGPPITGRETPPDKAYYIQLSEMLTHRLGRRRVQDMVNARKDDGLTPLLKACQKNSVSLVRFLISRGAQPSTVNYSLNSPLHIACNNSNVTIARILLENFPELARAATDEVTGGQLPIHTAASRGSLDLVQLLLEGPPYDDSILCWYVSLNKLAYRLAFDVNAANSSGLTAMYLACILNSEDLVSYLINFRVKGWHLLPGYGDGFDMETEGEAISQYIDYTREPVLFHPVDFKYLVAADTTAPLHRAVLNQKPSLARLLLEAGADVNLPFESSEFEQSESEKSTALLAAVKLRHAPLIRLLLEYGARDVDNHCLDRALQDAVVSPGGITLTEAPSSSAEILHKRNSNNVAPRSTLLKGGLENETALSLLLCHRAQVDPDHLLNRQRLMTVAFEDDCDDRSSGDDNVLVSSGKDYWDSGTLTSVNYAERVPAKAVAILWAGLKGLRVVTPAWLAQAAVHVNPQLTGVWRSRISLLAITTLHISGCSLTSLPDVIFQLESLVFLDASDNLLEMFPGYRSNGNNNEDVVSAQKKVNRIVKIDDIEVRFPFCDLEDCGDGDAAGKEAGGVWNIPTLRTCIFSRNQFTSVPSEFFHLPSLQTFDLSHNRLTTLSHCVWLAPALRDLNVSHNMLASLPGASPIGLPNENVHQHVGLAIPGGGTISRSPSTSTRLRLKENFMLGNSISSDGLTDSTDGGVTSAGADTSDGPGFTKEAFWRSAIHSVEDDDWCEETEMGLLNLNAAHNRLREVPPQLACLAPRLARLNLSGNFFVSMGPPSSYPNTLSTLDLSMNQIACQPLEQRKKSVRTSSNLTGDRLGGDYRASDTVCYHPSAPTSKRASASMRSVSTSSATSLSATCSHRSEVFSSLTHLNLNSNRLEKFHLSAQEEYVFSDDEGEEESASLMFPALQSLGLSHNRLTEISSQIGLQRDLQQLNASFNQLHQLPKEMGLLQKHFWRLEVKENPIEGQLAAMMAMNKNASDVLGYLKSILHDSQPYSSMKLMLVGYSNIGKTTLLSLLNKAAINKPNLLKQFQKSGKLSQSTVGVDIGDLVINKKSPGKVTFKTWDFGGQEEYYATHQYFLSKRSLYLVLWKMTDGEVALEGVHQWLINIQTRAPGSPVLIIGTHYDLVKKDKATLNSLRTAIEDRFMKVSDPSAHGLPEVIDQIEVSCVTGHNVKTLLDRMYDIVWSLRAPGSKTQLLLQQKFPASYVRLVKIVGTIAAARKAEGKDPVLKTEEYRRQVNRMMSDEYNITFREDDNELSQATQFLHDNGVLLHYKDVALNDLYFLDPQWLCDMLAKVVAVREVNALAVNGKMKLVDLQFLFKSSDLYSDDPTTYIVSLMNKFEVALVCEEGRSLLIPNLLPSESELASVKQPVDITLRSSSDLKRQVTVRTIRRKTVGSRPSVSEIRGLVTGQSMFYAPSVMGPETVMAATAKAGNGLVEARRTRVRRAGVRISRADLGDSLSPSRPIAMKLTSNKHQAIRRLYLILYIPSGFWPRLITRILNDETIPVLTEFFFDLPEEMGTVEDIQRFISRLVGRASWQCWKTGMSLRLLGEDILRVRQILPESVPDNYYTHLLTFDDKIQGVVGGHPLGVTLEVMVADLTLTAGVEASSKLEIRGKLLTKLIDHIEALLEDWYPEIGTRFLQSTSGSYLVSRVVPCPSCLKFLTTMSSEDASEIQDASWIKQDESKVYCHLFDDILLSAYHKKPVLCPRHADLDLETFVPDAVFADISDHLRLTTAEITFKEPLGAGAFGVVFSGVLRRLPKDVSNDDLMYQTIRQHNVAVKCVSPMDPGENASASLRQGYQQAVRRFELAPSEEACNAYFITRAELSILTKVQHARVTPLVGVLRSPLALVLPLAPSGSLNQVLQRYSADSARLSPSTAGQVILQVAEAMQYLHSEGIIYRDLKSDNVLVWSLPSPHAHPSQLRKSSVDVKLADYGVSRTASSGGTKGNWGTVGFVAPEIITHKGEELYTEKVDCYSFGMFVYELLSLKRPYYEQGPNLNTSYIIGGGRPKITSKELVYPSHMLDLMTLCWQHHASQRPSADQIVTLASSPEFCHLKEVVTFDTLVTYTCAAAFSFIDDDAPPLASDHHVFVCGKAYTEEKNQVGAVTRFTYQDGNCISKQEIRVASNCGAITMICIADKHLWVVDVNSTVSVFKVDKFTRQEVFTIPEPVAAIVWDDYDRTVTVVGERSGNLYVYSNFPAVSIKIVEREQGKRTLCAAISSKHGSLWLGNTDSKITVIYTRRCKDMEFELNHDVVEGDERKVSNDMETRLLAQDDVDVDSVWSYVHPGAKVYRWSTDMRQRHGYAARADCGAPNLPLRNSGVISAMVADRGALLCFTSTGKIMVLNSTSLDFLCVLQPYEDKISDVQLLLPLHPPSGSSNCNTLTSSSSANVAEGKSSRMSADKEGEEIPHSGGPPGFLLSIGEHYGDSIKAVMEDSTAGGRSSVFRVRREVCGGSSDVGFLRAGKFSALTWLSGDWRKSSL